MNAGISFTELGCQDKLSDTTSKLCKPAKPSFSNIKWKGDFDYHFSPVPFWKECTEHLL